MEWNGVGHSTRLTRYICVSRHRNVLFFFYLLRTLSIGRADSAIIFNLTSIGDREGEGEQMNVKWDIFKP
jgi:hypothetical protein